MVHGVVGNPPKTPGADEPSPQTGVLVVLGKMGAPLCQLALRAAWPPKLKASASRLMVPIPGVATPFCTIVAPVGTEAAPSKLPSARKDCIAICSYATPPPARITVFPLPRTSQAKPTRGAKLLWSPL